MSAQAQPSFPAITEDKITDCSRNSEKIRNRAHNVFFERDVAGNFRILHLFALACPKPVRSFNCKAWRNRPNLSALAPSKPKIPNKKSRDLHPNL
jgi:hypothetical protein